MDSHPTTFTILLVDDEEEILFSMRTLFRSAGYPEVLTESDSRRVMPLLERQPASLILLDLSMPFVSGFDLLRQIAPRFPQVPIIIVTAANELEMAVECMRSGAFDYFVKPVERSRLLASVQRARELNGLRQEVSTLSRQLMAGRLTHAEAFAPIITCSDGMQGIFHYLEAVAATDQPVLVTGETGTGKELAARAVHDASGRKGAFVAVNAAGLDDIMFSDTLFGHRRGAYTGADQKREGLIAQAAGGTLFLDEIGDLAEASQVKLLRLLQEHEYYPLGSDIPRKSDARIVVATNRDLQQMMAAGTFRRDLFFRLSAHRVTLPPLRERREDVPLLVDHFLEQSAAAMRKKKPTPPPELFQYLSAYSFPGNIRELQALVADAVARHRQGVLSLESFREVTGVSHCADLGEVPRQIAGIVGASDRIPTLKEAEDALIAEALRLAGGNQGLAASYLGITRQALNKRLIRRGESG
ncbi:sigma-54-dependent transcriptional regulator [Geobacter pickeringii]|uniref:Chemotaxis protein CheY n=1 Tax=Geobacter pickeringii TaxID=345632 RepID=A0A0B5BFE1_9BACT|nr:sigma-54 dependent transcriptional regulator [Geobacter pickeringii]AJE02791.1 chemotaxis protein CheY [Geobacter pickeringii]